jgi:hypothetical protein
MSGSTRVNCNGYMIEAVYTGTMTTELLEKTNMQIRSYIEKGCKCVLYNTINMAKPEMKHSILMKKFDSEVGSKLSACATVTSDSTTAFMAKMAFIFTPNHKVFYNNLNEAISWLQNYSLRRVVA